MTQDAATQGDALVPEQAAHVARDLTLWFDEHGVPARRLVCREDLSVGPLPQRLDADGLAVRAAFWNHGEQDVGEADLIALADAGVVVWRTDYGQSEDLLRAWVRSVADREGFPVWTAQADWKHEGPWQEMLFEDDALPEQDRQAWAAVTGPSPEPVAALFHSDVPWLKRTGRALLRWYPRVDTGLNHVQHRLLDEFIDPPDHPVKAIATVMVDESPCTIGDLTLLDQLRVLDGLGVLTCKGEGFRDLVVELLPLGRALQRGEARIVPPTTVVGGVRLAADEPSWAVCDHRSLELTRVGGETAG